VPIGPIRCDQSLSRIRPRPRDLGVTFVEILVTLVLLGLTVVAVLTATRTTIVATRVNRDHTAATAWLQSASDVLAGRRLMDCLNGPAVRDDYNDAIVSVPNSEEWPADRLSVAAVTFWTGTGWGACTSPYNLQLVTLLVTDADGAVLERLELVKGSYVGEVDGGA
jgi:hypothetical protein